MKLLWLPLLKTGHVFFMRSCNVGDCTMNPPTMNDRMTFSRAAFTLSRLNRKTFSFPLSVLPATQQDYAGFKMYRL